MKDSELINQLNQASQGLLWLSESDYPFQTLYWENVDEIKAKLVELTKGTPEAKIAVREVDSFFKRAIEIKDWYKDEKKAECRRYQALVALLTNHLTNLKVYRVGEIEIDIYIVGRTKSGNLAGLSTKVVET